MNGAERYKQLRESKRSTLDLKPQILIPIEEYKELLVYKGRYLEIKEVENETKSQQSEYTR